MQTPEHLKTEAGEESFNPDGLAQRSIKLLKDTFPDVEVRLLLSTYIILLLLQWSLAHMTTVGNETDQTGLWHHCGCATEAFRVTVGEHTAVVLLVAETMLLLLLSMKAHVDT